MFVLAAGTTSLYGQLMIDQSMTPQQLVPNVLVSGGVTVSNITFLGASGSTGSPMIARFYNGNTTNLGLDEGIVLCTGNVVNIPATGGTFMSTDMGVAGDPTLQSIGGNTSYDAAVLEFDFIPLDNTISFNYVFGSEEYPEYVGSSYNDAFGFFITGQNPGGGNYTNQNIALVPSTTTPVTINNVNSGSYSQYYINNGSGATIVYDGFTTVLTAFADVVPCQQYHIKIAICDIGDGIYDSGVFLQANSFGTDAVSMAVHYTNPALGLSAIEGCSGALVAFTTGNPVATPLTLNFTITGTSTNGTDYPSIPGTITIPQGSDSVGFTINPFMDGLPEGTETIIITVNLGCGTQDITVNVTDNTQLSAATSSDQIMCAGDPAVPFSVTPAGGISPYTYLWSNGGTNSTISVAPTTTTQYYVTVTDACGATSVDNANVLVNPLPTSDFTVITPICVGDPSGATYTGNSQGPGATYQWNFGPAVNVVGSGAGPYTFTYASAGTFPITLTVTSAAGCESTTTTMYAQVYPLGTSNCCEVPTPEAGPTQSVCGLTASFAADPPDYPSYTGTWSIINTPVGGVANIVDVHSNLSSVNVTMAGTYTFQWYEVNGSCNANDQVTITFVSQPQANAGADVEICALSSPLTGVQSVAGSTLAWTGTGGSFSPANTAATTVTVGTYGTYNFILTETNGTCISRDTVLGTFLVTPNAAAGPDQTSCGYTAQLDADDTYPGYWSSSIPSALFLPDIYDPNARVRIPNYLTPTYPVTFTWHASNGPCYGTDNVVVTFIKPPHAEAGPTQSVCGTLTSMNADTIGSQIINAYWVVQPNGPVINTGGSTIPAHATLDISSLVPGAYHLSRADYYMYWVVQNGQGCIGYDSVLVSFYEIPDAFAGVDDSVCGKTYDLVGQYSLDNPSGNWSVYSKPYVTSTANFVPAQTPNGEVTVSDYGVYQFIWRESNAGNLNCYDRDTLEVNFMTIPHPDAGLDQSVCGKFVELYANTTPGTDGYWQSILNAWYDPTEWAQGDTVQCTPCSNDSSVVAYYSSENDTVTYYWMEFYGQCYGYDSVNVYFGSIQPANHLVNAADSINCGRLTELLVAQEPTYGDGYWYDSVPLTTFYPNNYNDKPDSTVISNSSYGMHYFYWVTENGDCRDTSDAVPINFIRQPVALAGPITSDPNTNTYFPGIYGPNSNIKADTVCGLAYKLHAIPSYGNGLWFTLDPTNTYFESSGTAAPSPYPQDTANINYYTVFNAPYYREFVWIEDNLSCVDKDTIRVYFAPRPSGNFTVTMPACRYDSSKIVAHTWPLPNNVDYGINYFGWDFGSGVIWDTSVNVFNTSTIYVSWPGGGNSHSVTLITENQWECRSTINQHTVNEPPLFSPNYDINPATCDNSNGEVILSTSSNNYAFEWLDSTIVNATDTGQTGLTPGYTYHVVVTGESLSPDAAAGTFCHDTIGITMTNAGNITALFDTMFTQMLPVPQSVALLNLTNNGRRFSWRIFDEDGNLVGTTSTENPTWNFEDPGCYRLVLVAESKVDSSWFGIERFGCKDTFEYKWLCFDATPILEVPNVFTPNGDGINDVFLVNGKSITEFHAVLFNRWGKKIYEWDDYTKGWDGKIGGADASPGVYYYIIDATGKDESTFELKGFFYLMREK